VLGAVTGFFPIGWIVLNVIFLYRLTVAKGAFETLQTTIGAVMTDRRIQLLLIAFSFGAFFEGASGFGTPVAVTGAILIGLGFSPLAASGLSLIANTAPVAYGALGTPIAGLASVTGLDPYILGAMVGRQLPFFSVIVPFWLIWAFAGWRGMLQIWPFAGSHFPDYLSPVGVIGSARGNRAPALSFLLRYCIWPFDSSNPGCTAGEMMGQGSPRDWMWSQACEMLSRAERLNRDLFRPLGSVARMPAWEPPVDMLETEREVLVLVALPGVNPDRVEAILDGSDLVVAGTRVLPSELRTAVIHRLELPQGRFERRVRLPAGRYSAVHRSAIDGCLLITLQKLGAFLG
jgi:HSP20 family molecular chaperone IbpA